MMSLKAIISLDRAFMLAVSCGVSVMASQTLVKEVVFMMGVLEVIRAVVCWQGLNLFGVFFVISFESNAKQTLHL